MSAMSRPPPLAPSATASTPGSPLLRRRRAAAPARDALTPVRRIGTLIALALLVGLQGGAFAGILLFVGGLAALAAYAAAHPRP
jgi:hypothetical protein